MPFDINYLAVVVAMLVAMVIGYAWYSPALFGNAWIKEMDFTGPKPDGKKMAKQFSIMGLSQLIMAAVLAAIIQLGDAATFGAGMTMAAWVWLGFFATTMTGSVTWEGKSWKLYVINVAYWLVALLVMGGILAVWN